MDARGALSRERGPGSLPALPLACCWPGLELGRNVEICRAKLPAGLMTKQVGLARCPPHAGIQCAVRVHGRTRAVDVCPALHVSPDETLSKASIQKTFSLAQDRSSG